MIRTAIIAIGLSIYTLFVGPPMILHAMFTDSVEKLYWAGVHGVIFFTRLVGLRVRVEGVENIPPGVCLFVANHTSNADAPAIVGAIPRRIAILAKRSIFSIPIVGYAFRMAHFVPVDRANRESAMASIELAAKYLREGTSFLAYPEGTRSPDGRLQEFKKGSFVMAIKAGVQVVPVACCGAHRIMKKRSLVIHPGQAVVRFLPPIDASAYTLEQRDELSACAHASLAAALPPDQQPLPVNSPA